MIFLNKKQSLHKELFILTTLKNKENGGELDTWPSMKYP